MSHEPGMVRFPDGLVLHYEYNGTCDVVCTALKRSVGELDRDWRTPANLATCTCGRAPEPVDVVALRGGGYAWPGKACRRCMALVEGLMPYRDDLPDVTIGIPEWAAIAIKKSCEETP